MTRLSSQSVLTKPVTSSDMGGSDELPMSEVTCSVAIIGAGPAGLSLAIRLRKMGLDSVIVLERETTAGGAPRHCGHPPFGVADFHRVMTGPQYARRLAEKARKLGVDIRLQHSVVRLMPGPELLISHPGGMLCFSAQRIVLATGIREAPRSARLASGGRPLGLFTTGVLQSMIYMKGRLPFKRPVVVGTELVSYSALWTCCKVGIKPMAMIEEAERPTARYPLAWGNIAFGVPLYVKSTIAAIDGNDRVESVCIRHDSGRTKTLNCDAVLFTGSWTPEAALARMGHLEIDSRTGGPSVDQYGRCSDPNYYAIGNVTRPVETAGWCASEGSRAAAYLVADLKEGSLSTDQRLRVEIDDPLKYVVPQYIARGPSDALQPPIDFQIRLARAASGRLTLKNGEVTIASKRITSRPERRLSLQGQASKINHDTDDLIISLN